MPKELMTMELERDNLQQKWGLTIQGGADLALTAKIASVKVRKTREDGDGHRREIIKTN